MVYEFTEEDRRMLSRITQGENPSNYDYYSTPERDSTISLQYCILFMAGRKIKKGYLHWKKEDLQRAVESSRKSISLAKVIHAGPHFIRHAKMKS